MDPNSKKSLSPVSLSMHDGGRETLHMWLSILIAIFVAGYRLFLQFMDRLATFLEPHTELPIAEWLEKTLFFWSKSSIVNSFWFFNLTVRPCSDLFR